MSQDDKSALETLLRRGYVIIPSLVSRNVLHQIKQELAPWFEKTPTCIGDFYGWKTTRVNAVLRKSPASQALLLHARVLSIVDAVLGEHCDWYQLNLSQAIRVHPGERHQIPHCDDAMWPCAKNGVEYMINVMWALDEFTVENGATRLWPGATVTDTACLDPRDATVAQMQPGAALLYLGSIAHGAGANVSDRERTGLVFSYCLGWLKTYENMFLSYPPEIAHNFSPQVRALLGYRIHRPNLGHYEGQDPSILFNPPPSSLGMTDALPESIASRLKEYYDAP
jgi:ectoine hydroxylase-related dioxygenase (phytanoyl-CoA dioxygenase family)